MGLLDTLSNASMLHAAVVHLPIVLVLLGVPLIYFLAVSQQRTETLRWFVAGFYAVTALLSYFAVLSGRGAMDRIPNGDGISEAVWTIVDRHEEMGEKVWVFALAVAVLLALSAIPVRVVRLAFVGTGMLVAFVLLVWVAVLGHFGGVLVYEHGIGTPAVEVAQPTPTEPAEPENPEPTEAPEVEGDATPAIRPIDMEAAKALSFTKDVWPILEESCEECHNPDKMRGDFDATSVAAMIDGGKKGGPGIVPGKPDESSIVKYIRGTLRPQMPKGEDPLTDDQLHVIRQWIAAGAIDDAGATPAPDTPLLESPATAPAAEVEVESPQETTEPPATTVPSAESVEASPAGAVGALTVDELLFSGGPEDLLVKRRAYRMALVPKPPAPPGTGVPVNNDIDHFIAAKWHAADPAYVGAVCDDSAFARRVFLDVVGAVPGIDEVRAFVQDNTADKRANLVDALLARNGDYAAHWTPFWEDALCSNGNHQGGVGTRGNYRTWIYDSFKANKAYDAMVAELIDPHMPGHPDRFILRQDHTRILKSAADTAQVFLGTQMKCAGCHNHFDNREWPQRRFYGFAGYFGDKDLELIKCEAHTEEFVPTGFVFDMPDIPTDVPATVNERAARIAQLLVDPCNPRFSKTIVNRLWKRFLGMGLFEPVDNYREDTPASHPELLEWLAYDFMANGYDIKHTMRLILTSRTYELAYDPALEDHFDIAKPAEPRYFRSPRLRRMTAEQLLDSVKVALGEKLAVGARAYQSDESTPLSRALGRPATRNEVSTARAEDAAVVQTLELLNGDEYHDRIYGGAFVLASAQRGREASLYDGVIDDLYWSVLGRAPADPERAAGIAFVGGATIDPDAADLIDSTVLDDALPEGATRDGSQGADSWNAVHGPDAPVFSGGVSWKLSQPPAPAPVEPLDEAVPATPDDVSVETVPSDPATAKTAAFAGSDTDIQFAVSVDQGAVVLAQDAPAPQPTEPIAAVPDAPAQPLTEPAARPAPVALEQSLAALPQPIIVNADDVLYAYVYFDPTDPPKAIMVEWKEGDSWEHRAYWGANVLKMDIAEGPQRYAMGALPEVGTWVRLAVPAYLVGLGRTRQGISGISISQAGGTAYWDKAGALGSPLGGPTTAVGDALWALITSPEFQYIR